MVEKNLKPHKIYFPRMFKIIFYSNEEIIKKNQNQNLKK